jgi:hypothetical protein
METLTVYESIHAKRRIGSNGDGGYVVIDLPGTYDFFISGGVGNDVTFEVDLLEKYQNIRGIAFDGTVNSIPMKHPRLEFRKLNLAKHNSSTTTNLLDEMRPYNNIFMKMDIEGHEFNVLPGIIDSCIKKVKQLVIEIHTPGDIMKHPDYFRGLSHFDHGFMFNMLKDLNATHTLVHFHANNGCDSHVVDGIKLPNVIECTYIRNDYVKEKVLNTTPFPTELDRPNVPYRPEYIVDYPPFCHKPTNRPVTVVSCYYRIPSKFPPAQYDEWIANFMSLPMNTIIYSTGEALRDLEAKYPASEKRKYIDRPIAEFELSKYDLSHDLEMDKETSIGHSIDLYKVWGEKTFFIADAIARNVYKSNKFLWCDIGCFRDTTAMRRFEGFPTGAQIIPGKITMLQLEPFRGTDVAYPINEQFRGRVTVGGTVFGGYAETCLWFRDAYASILGEANKAGVFKGKDQDLFAFLIMRNPTRFNLLRPLQNESYNSWFHLHIYMSKNVIVKPLHFAFVGPGIMPIPPTGWGACEILIWDMAQTLRAQGHKVTIVNTPDMAEALSQLLDSKPDVVHIQYDDHAYLAPLISPHVKLVAITSHYGYLDQPQRWGGYMNTFQTLATLDAPNLYHFVLSPSIANIYKLANVLPSRIRITPNGADAGLFHYTDAPKCPERSIVLGKIEPRKGQYKLMHNPNVWFAGNRHGHEFDYTNPRWLGEWAKPQLYEDLTNYGNMVLLSDGEADPLVTKEALMAGLGLVLSPWAAANLDLTKPYITIIPHDRMNDRQYIDRVIEENRRIAVSMRHDIRKYGLEFSWANRMKDYTKMVSELLCGSE